MDIAKNVAAGLLLAVLLGLARWGAARWRLRRSASHISLDPLELLMGKPLPKPALPPSGAHRELNELLHELHSRAAYPSPFSLARTMGVSRTSLHDAMSKPKLPSKDIAVQLALAYAIQIRWGASVNPEEKLDDIDRRVQELWEMAYREAALPDPGHLERLVQEVWDDMANGLGPCPPSDPVTKALARSSISIHVWERFVTVIVDACNQDDRTVLGCYAEGTTCRVPWRVILAAEVRSRLAPEQLSLFAVDLVEDVELELADGFLRPPGETDSPLLLF
ncbi:hypothetical protein [Streptomyces sp. NPDC053560]|uniref:hypothetical protein n=1 Tax=Streptomyces sp. NPDC053560 TaxID=3365711 RepID=UPI0037D2C2BE